MDIRSDDFKNQQPIPKKFTCDGQGVSPVLHFHDVPQQSQSLVLIVDDPDAPSGTFDHWVVWNIPSDTQKLVEGAQVGTQGVNGMGSQKYFGPCPPHGKPHRYFFKLFALDKKLDLKAGSSKQAVEEAMEGHVLDKAELVGTYQR